MTQLHLENNQTIVKSMTQLYLWDNQKIVKSTDHYLAQPIVSIQLQWIDPVIYHLSFRYYYGCNFTKLYIAIQYIINKQYIYYRNINYNPVNPTQYANWF